MLWHSIGQGELGPTLWWTRYDMEALYYRPRWRRPHRAPGPLGPISISLSRQC